ncbi:hypothetical protein JY651_38220 [Pyxidicoccus parkwayensis]|uniref:Uncharacterized protein n=1 Tax=Pyxidicoccus parkwayensis TaxID=2813578 RepID=A0ABX7NRD5_9BACT|nr:hypothetical protein [Pyxidicoccus parkwaysis]QSQ20998.1 hypothetical protein JY651_38220 [Pyxidicoccus parkwaysis]
MKGCLLLLALGMAGVGEAAEQSAAPKPAEKVKPASKPKAPKAPEPAPSKPPASSAAPSQKAPSQQPPAPPASPASGTGNSRLSELLGEDEPELLKEIPPDVKVPPVYRQPFVWDVPRVKDIIDVPGMMLADGIPVRMKAVRTAEKIEPLMQHIVERWVEWGLYVAPIEQQPQKLQEPMLTALDPERLITYSVIFQPNPDGTTTLYLGEADMSKPPAVMTSVAPAYPGAEGIMTSDLETVRSVNYAVRAKEAEVDAFYRTELGKAGFKEVEPRRFRAGQEEVEVILKPLQPGKLSVAVLRRTVAPDAVKPPGN